MKNTLQNGLKRAAYLAMIALLGTSQLLSSGPSSAVVNSQTSKASVETSKTFNKKNEVRAVWISYYELEPLLKNKSEVAFRTSIKSMFSDLSKDHMNTVMVQVRPFGDAIYKSKLYPTSYMMTGTEGDKLAYDPLSIIIEEAKSKSIKIEAWINPYRVRLSSSKVPISADNTATKWLADSSNRVVKLSGGTFYNPSDKRVNALVVEGVKELIQNYAIDGIHFDDYFYPTQEVGFDKVQYDAYVKMGGKLGLSDFRREQINQMVKDVYKVCKSGKKKVTFGISPQGLIKTNYDQQYADVKKWVTEKGYVDYICPQIYYGFKNSKAPFIDVLKEWDELTKNSSVKVYIGLASYKIGTVDKWSGTGKQEWLEDQQILSRMVQESRMLNKYNGFVLFRYDSLWRPSSDIKDKANLEKESLIQLCM